MDTSETPAKTVFVTRPIADEPLKRLARATRVDLWPSEQPPSHDELLAHLAGADAIISMVSDRLDASALARAPRLAVISNYAVGLDNIDVAAATAAGIAVGHTPGILTETTADLAFALLCAAARRVAEGDRFVRAGQWRAWSPNLLLGRDLYGATLGVVGYGAIGQAIARRAAGFNMRILYTSRQAPPPSASHPVAPGQPAPPARVSLDHLLAESDFVSVTVALTPDTRHLIGAREFALMKPGAIIVNAARGPIVDQSAMLAALESGRLAGAGLDVTETEPIAPGDPLLDLPNVVITPHIGSASHATRLRMAALAVDNVLEVLKGRLPRWCANPDVRLRFAQ